jgi:hypothetical protein
VLLRTPKKLLMCVNFCVVCAGNNNFVYIEFVESKFVVFLFFYDFGKSCSPLKVESLSMDGAGLSPSRCRHFSSL